MTNQAYYLPIYILMKLELSWGNQYAYGARKLGHLDKEDGYKETEIDVTWTKKTDIRKQRAMLPGQRRRI